MRFGLVDDGVNRQIFGFEIVEDRIHQPQCAECSAGRLLSGLLQGGTQSSFARLTKGSNRIRTSCEVRNFEEKLDFSWLSFSVGGLKEFLALL